VLGLTVKEKHCGTKSIYNVEEKANVVGVGTDFKFKIFSGNSVCGPPPPPPPLNHSIG
jgi:hypothetical protein